MNDRRIPQYNWPGLLQEAAFKANTSMNSSTKHSPYEVMYGDLPSRPSVICTPAVSKEGALTVEEAVEEAVAAVSPLHDNLAYK